jgi:diaminopimelate decarboxylase
MSRPESDANLDEVFARVAEDIGTPAYVYIADKIEKRLADLRQRLGDWFSLSYAAKCNPNPELLRWLAARVESIDVSSIGEFRLACSSGWDASRVSFTGPGKRATEIQEAIAYGVGQLVIENRREALIADHVAQELGRKQDVLIRLSPDSVPKGFGDYMAGRASPFGFDIETAGEDIYKILHMQNINVIGFHIYSGTQCLKAPAIRENYKIFTEIFSRICGGFHLVPRTLVFGSGLGIPYHEQDVGLDLDEVGQEIGPVVSAFRSEARFKNTELVLELGRYVVGEAGYFLTRVTAIKESRGRRIGICDGGMNNHLAASGHFGMVIHRNYMMHRVGGGTAEEAIDLVGPLCTSIDRIGSGVILPRLEEGDLLAVHSSGAYGLTASPIHFISHPPPFEVMVEASRLRDVTRAWSLR